MTKSTFEKELEQKQIKEYIQDASYNCEDKVMTRGIVKIKEPHIKVEDVLKAKDKAKKEILQEIKNKSLILKNIPLGDVAVIQVGIVKEIIEEKL